MMAPQAKDASSASLRALSFCLSSTPTSQLPQQLPALTASLLNCKTVLSSDQTSASKSSDSSVILQKYRTQLTTLLQDRTVQGRLAAIVLVKSTIEVGGREALSKSLPWVRGLLGILRRPDPAASRKLAIITLTRIFLLTRDLRTLEQDLVREITTPSLPTFIQTCLHLVSSVKGHDLLETVLESFHRLLPRHPSIFRSYRDQLNALLNRTIAVTPSSTLSKEQNQKSSTHISFNCARLARRLYVQLPQCAPKDASSEQWANLLKDNVSNAHRVADKVFRAVVEEWKSTSGYLPTTTGRTLENEVQDLQTDSQCLPPWSGLYAGVERLLGLLRLIKEFVATPMAAPSNFRLGLMVDLLSRLFYITIPRPSNQSGLHNAMKFNAQVGKDEREMLWSCLPNVHIAALEVLIAIIQRSGDAVASLASVCIDQIAEVFAGEHEVMGVRTAVYVATERLLKLSGPTLPKSSVDSLRHISRTCCDDLLQEDSTTNVITQRKSNGSAAPSATIAGTSVVSSLAPKPLVTDLTALRNAASRLLPALLSDLPTQFVPNSLRTRMETTAILVQHKDAMLVSILNPPPRKKLGKEALSIMPHIARSFAVSNEVECLLRPRMPAIRSVARELGNDDEEEEIEEETFEEGNAVEDETERFEPVPDVSGSMDEAERDLTMRTVAVEETSNELLEVVMEKPETDSILSGAANKIDSSSTGRPSKRESDHTPASPAKRIRLQEQTTQATYTSPPETVVQQAPVSFVPSAENVTAVDDVQLVVEEKTPEEATPKAPAVDIPAGEDGSDEDDDFGTLVLGPDSDEESAD